MPYWFILGREPLLSYAELLAFFPTTQTQYHPPFLKVSTPELPPNFIARLGGTVKIARELESSFPIDDLENTLLKHLTAQTGKIIFGLSWYTSGTARPKTPQELETLGKRLKKTLQAQEEDRSVRYIPNREAILSSVTVDKNNLTKRGAELIIHDDGSGQLSLAQTTAVQPFEAFSERDFGRPGRDDKSGMLPPKLALMMLNLAKKQPNQTILDPFCGSGTILTEALLAGYTSLMGSDISEKAHDDTLRNRTWIEERGKLTQPIEFLIFTHDVRTLTEKISAGSIDAIVTEPFLGKPLTGREKNVELEQQLKNLASLYEEALDSFKKLLKPSGTVVMIVPRYRSGPTWATLPFADMVKRGGFRAEELTPGKTQLLYARAAQYVGREVWRLVKE